MPIPSDQYGQHSAYELLTEAARGHVPTDQRLLHRLLDNAAETLPDIIRFANEDRSKDRVDLSVDLMRIFAAQPTAEAVPFLIGEFRRFPEEIPDEMSEALARIGAPALEGLLELFDEGIAFDEVPFHLVTLGVRDPRIQEAIDEIRSKEEEEGAYLQEVYDEYVGQTPEPYDIFKEYPETDIPDLDLLPLSEREEFLSHDSPDLRALALDYLLGTNLEPAEVNRILKVAQTDSDDKVRGLAWEALRESTDEERIKESMLARLDNPNTPAIERAGLCIGLAYNLDDPIVRPYLDAAYEEEQTRAKAIEAMARSFDRGFAPIVVKHLDDADVETRRAALWGVGYLRIHSEAPRLEKLFLDPEWRGEALYCYALCAPADDSRLGLRQLEDRMAKLAEGLEEEEHQIVHSAFDLRLEMAGKKTRFTASDDHEHAPSAFPKVGRNDPCPCGSGKKFKKCCGAA